ncbi:hypothetical protein LTS10_008310 [Elasticomyces elasticus]|nr:hypothetical protein LTS10_008310 [Elasticomyces elasticus]
MESRKISIPAFASLAFDKISWSSIISLTTPGAREAWDDLRRRDTTQSGRDSTSWRLTLFLATFAYILVFPAWMSIMTGYQAQAQPYVLVPGGNLIPATALVQPDAVVFDDTRALASLAYIDSTSLGAVQRFQDNSTDPAQWTFTVVYSVYSSLDSLNTTDTCFKCRHCYQYSDYEWYCSTFINSTITISNHTYTLQQPLDVAMPDRPRFQSGLTIPDAAAYWSYNTEALSNDYLQHNTTCQPLTDYQWGFSSLLLFAFCVTSLVFAIVMFFLDAVSYLEGCADRLDVPANVYRDALDLSIDLRARYGEEVDQMPSRELLNLVEHERSEMSLDLTHLPQNRKEMRKQQRGRGRTLNMDREAVAAFLERAKASWAGSGLVVHEELGLSDSPRNGIET